jgi:hypothetical protein
MNDIHKSERHTRIFISCGQSKQSDEAQIAEKIAHRLLQLGEKMGMEKMGTLVQMEIQRDKTI